MKFKKGDEIIITAGKDKGKKGKIERVFPKDQKVVILGLNLYKRNVKKRNEQSIGGIMEFPRPLPVSKIALVDPTTGKPTRIGFVIKNNVKSRVAKQSKTVLSK
jgi:large subunit ribosomal protein L24